MFPLLTLSGDPRARGRHYGETAAPLVRHSIASYARLFAYRRGLDWSASQELAMAYAPLLADQAPALLAEMAGIAEGAGCALAEIVALNVRTELLAGTASGKMHPWYQAAVARNRAAGVPQHPEEDDRRWTADGVRRPTDDGECTSAAAMPGAAAGGAALLAQTWDWAGDQRAACVLLRISAPGRPDILTLTEAGIVAKIGLNGHGLAVSLNLLRSYTDGQTPGMPVHVLLRLMLETGSVDAAAALARQAPAGASSCITVVDAAGQAASIEITPGAIAALGPTEGLLVHSNHCLAPHTAAGERALEATSTTLQRYGRATALLQSRQGAIDTAALMELLRDHHDAPRSICRHPDPGYHPCDRNESITGVVMDLAERVMHIAPGIPCEVEFEAIAL